MDPAVQDRYLLVEELTRTPHAKVFVAMLRTCGDVLKPCLFKQVTPRASQQPGFAERLRANARVTACLSHSNVVSLLDIGEAAAGWFVVTELVQGCNLSQLARSCREAGRRPPAAAGLYVLHDVLSAIDYCKRVADELSDLATVHREVTASNLLLTFEGEVKVATFGLELTQPRTASVESDIRRSAALVVEWLLEEELVGRDTPTLLELLDKGATNGTATEDAIPIEIKELLGRVLNGRFSSPSVCRTAVRDAWVALDPHYGAPQLSHLLDDVLDVDGQRRRLAALIASAEEATEPSTPSKAAPPLPPRPAFGSLPGAPDQTALPDTIIEPLPSDQRRDDATQRPSLRGQLGVEPTVLSDGIARIKPQVGRIGDISSVEIDDGDVIEVFDLEGEDVGPTTKPQPSPSSAYVMRQGKLIRIRLIRGDK